MIAVLAWCFILFVIVPIVSAKMLGRLSQEKGDG